MNSKRWIALGIAAGLFIFSSAIQLFSISTFSGGKLFQNNEDQGFSEEVYENGGGVGKVVILDVSGPIMDSGEVTSILESPTYNHRKFLKMLDQAAEDNNVKGIILRVNSPGGGVMESAEIHDRLVEIKEETQKPIYVSMGSMAASGGYYIATPATKIFASKETLTGSLGVIMQSFNYGELAEKYGVKVQTIKTGQYKDIMSPMREMTDKEREILQTMANNSYEGFVDVIAEGRNMSENQVRKIADGRIYDGRQAKELGLVDDFGFLEDVMEAIKTEQELGDVSFVKYSNDLGFSSLFEMTAQKLTSGKDMELLTIKKLINTTNSPRLMYLYTAD